MRLSNVIIVLLATADTLSAFTKLKLASQDYHGLNLSPNDDQWSSLSQKLAHPGSPSFSAKQQSITSFQQPKLPDFVGQLHLPSFSLPEAPSMPVFPWNVESSATSVTSKVPLWLDQVHSFPIAVQLALIAGPTLAIFSSFLYSLSFPPEDYRTGIEPYERGNYDPMEARAYYSKKPKVVYQRALQVARLSNRFLIGILLDKYIFRNEEAMRPQRAKELLKLITQLGPTAIKVGQALSVRPDLIAQEYSEALATLQDQVPPFPNVAAKRLLEEQLEAQDLDKLEGLSNSNPVASASIGQVYKARIGDQEVAVKVQRPNVLADIALDLFLVREFAPFYQKYIARSQTDLQGLANEWGRGFIAELDYQQEAAKTTEFNVAMQKRNLDAVCAPTVLDDFSTEQVLVTGWIDGVRIDQSQSDDIPRLCSVALNAYLVMLLELQSLHCDPHPGNLLRTTDGKLCILDFGMTLDVEPTLQYSLLEYIAHCTSDNYEAVPDDLVNLGFLKPDRLEFAKRSGVLDPLVYFLRQAGKGGGAKAVRERVFAEFKEKYPGLDEKELRVKAREEMQAKMKDVAKKESIATGITTEVEELQKRNRDSFTIPEWFVYCSRAFITLEGVSLQADESYSLIQSCFPYVAKRLVKDDSVRAQNALKQLLYGAGDMIDVDRLGELADGFSTYTTTTKTTNAVTNSVGEAASKNGGVARSSSKDKLVEAEAAILLAKDSADVLLDPKGNLVQNLLVQESTLATSAKVKDQLKDTLVDGPQRLRDSLPFGVGGILPPLPFEVVVAPFVQKTESESKAQALLDKVGDLVAKNGSSDKSGTLVESNESPFSILDGPPDFERLQETLRELDPEQAAFLVKELRENLPKYSGLVGQLGTKFVGSLLEKASENIETTLQQEETNTDGQIANNRLLQVAAKGVSDAAQQGARSIKQQQQRERETQMTS